MKDSRKLELFDELFKYVVETIGDGDEAHGTLEKLGFTANEIYDCAGLENREPDDDNDFAVCNDSSGRETIKTEAGAFDVVLSRDSTYPGVDVEFIPHNDEELDNVSRPRILFEQPVGCKPRLLIWGNPDSEDYSEQVVFDNNKFYVKQNKN